MTPSSEGDVAVTYCCCQLRTACLIIGYIGVIVYPILLIAYILVEILVLQWEEMLAGDVFLWTKLGTNTFFDIITIMISVLLVVGIHTNQLKYVTLWIYVILLLLVWCFLNIIASVFFQEFISLGYLVIKALWFIQGLFLVRAYRLCRTSEMSFITFIPLALTGSIIRKPTLGRLSLKSSVVWKKPYLL